MIQEHSLVQDFLSLKNQAKDIAVCLNSNPSDEDVIMFAGLSLGLRLTDSPRIWLTGNWQTKLNYPHKQEVKLSGQGNRDLVINLPLLESQIERVYTTVDKNQQMQVIVEPKNGQSPPAESVSISYQGLKVDLVILINVAKLDDLDDVYDKNRLLFQEVPIVHFHNQSISDLGKLNFTFSQGQGVSLLVELFDKANLEINPKGADVLLWGLRYLTGNFQPPTSAQVFKAAAWLLEHGANEQTTSEVVKPSWVKPQPIKVSPLKLAKSSFQSQLNKVG